MFELFEILLGVAQHIRSWRVFVGASFGIAAFFATVFLFQAPAFGVGIGAIAFVFGTMAGCWWQRRATA